MSDNALIAVLSAIPPTLLALGAFVQAWKTNTKVTTNIDKTDNQTVKLDTQTKKLDEIHELANSNLTNVKEALDIANSRIEALEKLVKESKLR